MTPSFLSPSSLTRTQPISPSYQKPQQQLGRSNRFNNYLMMPLLAQADHINYDAGFYTGIHGADGFNNTTNILHTVSKFDTLPGLAIKYGVEVAEIMKVNGLVTDRQMFALSSLLIPLPGRHPSSYSAVCNASAATSTSNIDLLTPPRQQASQQKVSSNMNNLQNFYGLKPPTSKGFSTCKEVGGCKTRKLNEKSRTAGNGPGTGKGLSSSYLLLMESLAAEGSVDSYCHHWLKSEHDFGWETSENVSRKENEASRCSSFSSITRKGLALRPKSASRRSQASHDSEWSTSSSCSGDSLTADAGNLNKSNCYYNMPDQDENSFSSFWSKTKHWIEIDLLNLSTSTLTKPLLEGPPIHTLKAALD